MTGEIVVRNGEIYPQPQPVSETKKVLEAYAGLVPDFYFYQKQQPLSEPLSIDAARSIQTGQSFLWFFGRVVYDDVFGREHETRFCWC